MSEIFCSFSFRSLTICDLLTLNAVGVNLPAKITNNYGSQFLHDKTESDAKTYAHFRTMHQFLRTDGKLRNIRFNIQYLFVYLFKAMSTKAAARDDLCLLMK